MNCPRCNLLNCPEQINEYEFAFFCEFCGYQYTRFINYLEKEHPIFEEIVIKPDGIIFTDDKNYSYFSSSQKEAILKKYPNNKGYTSYDKTQNTWKVHIGPQFDKIENILSI